MLDYQEPSVEMEEEYEVAAEGHKMCTASHRVEEIEKEKDSASPTQHLFL